MSRKVQAEKDVAITLEFYPPEAIDGGVPTAAEIYVYQSGTSSLDSSSLDPATITLDTVSEALTVAAAKGDETITVGDSSGIVKGRRYIVSAANGERQEVTAIGQLSGVIKLDAPLRFACPVTTSSIDGHRLAQALTTTHTATRRRNLRAVWSYTIDSVVYRSQYHFDIVLSPFRLAITERDVEKMVPRFGETIGARDSWHATREQAIDDVFNDLRSMQVKPDQVLERDAIKDLAIVRLLWLLAATSSERDKWGEDYKRRWGNLTSSDLWYDADDDEVFDVESQTTYTTAAGETVLISGGTAEIIGGGGEAGLPVKYARVG